jgi:hypothetical protein
MTAAAGPQSKLGPTATEVTGAGVLSRSIMNENPLGTPFLTGPQTPENKSKLG